MTIGMDFTELGKMIKVVKEDGKDLVLPLYHLDFSNGSNINVTVLPATGITCSVLDW